MIVSSAVMIMSLRAGMFMSVTIHEIWQMRVCPNSRESPAVMMISDKRDTGIVFCLFWGDYYDR